MNAIKLRNVMLASIGLIVILISVTIYYASEFLHDETVKSVHTRIDAEVSERDLDRLKSLQKVLSANQDSVRKAEQIVAATQQYQYQDQIINDINSYARQTGVEVTAYNFGTDTAATKSTVPQPKVAGIKTISATLTLKSPLPFDNYLRFLKAIEKNLTKMQISGVNITPDPADINGVVNPSIGLVVYVR